VASEQVQMWRPPDQDRLLLMSGRTTRYAVDPRGEYVFGVVTGAPMQARRGREQRLVRPGDLVAWDPSHAHDGAAVDGRPWTARLAVVETADLAALAGDGEAELPAGLEFPDPVCADRRLAADFLRWHTALEATSTRLERDERLATWLTGLLAYSSGRRPAPVPLGGRDDRALRSARDYLAENVGQNVGLEELAAAAGVGRFRLIRLFRHRTGLAPHTLQLAYRVRAARRLLEAGHSIAETAAATGFADQSHLHRHFQRGLGMTPGEYRRRFIDQRS
jgi:AraC-like DNA-binding protein